MQKLNCYKTRTYICVICAIIILLIDKQNLFYGFCFHP